MRLDTLGNQHSTTHGPRLAVDVDPEVSRETPALEMIVRVPRQIAVVAGPQAVESILQPASARVQEPNAGVGCASIDGKSRAECRTAREDLVTSPWLHLIPRRRSRLHPIAEDH